MIINYTINMHVINVTSIFISCNFGQT